MVEKSFIIGFGQPSLADVLPISSAALKVELDASAAQRVKKESPPPKQFQAEEKPECQRKCTDTYLPADVIRAALFFKLNNVVNGKSKCRLSVAEQLCAMLNSGVIPGVCVESKTDKEVFSVIADACHGVGVDIAGEDLATAFDKASIETLALSTDERLILEDGMSCSSGIASLCVQEGLPFLSLSTFVVALSAEVLQAEVKCFDSDVAETFPLKEANASADVLRSMLSGSTQAVLKKNNNVISSVVDVPTMHGAIKSAMAVVGSSARASLGAVSLPPHKSGSHRHYIVPSFAQDVLSLASLILDGTSLSLERIELMLNIVSTDSTVQKQANDIQGLLFSLKNSSQMLSEKMSQLQSDIRSNGTTPHVACCMLCLESLQCFSNSVRVEALCALIGISLSKKSFESRQNDVEMNGKAKKKMPTFSLGKGTEALVEILEDLLRDNTSCEDGLKELQLHDAPEPIPDVSLAYSILTQKMTVVDPGFKGIFDAVNRVLEANATGRKPKIAKGARDFGPEQMAIREVAFQKIVNVFKKHGAVSIDTPVFELRETLMGKYGEDSKLIYDLADQGGELLSLRYDLTVPFARHVAVHGITNIKRYHIAKVYRRDQPQMNKGRYREFFQCDFDIAGVYSPMVPDAEVLKVLVEILDDLSLGDYEIKINHRKLLDAMLDIAGVPSQKFRPICSAIDKLDKEPWEVVKKEMVEEKGLPESVADKIGEFVVLRGEPRQLLTKLQEASHPLANHPESAAALKDLEILFEFLDVMGALKPFSFDLSLARGLDYYTGVIYEAVFKGGSVGSIAAGGRYDHLVGMFSGKEVPAVGVSIGIERVFAILEAQMKEMTKGDNGTIRETETEVLVASIGNGLQPQRMKIASDLWSAGIKCEFGFKPNPKMGDQLNYALKSGIPLVILFGEDEIHAGQVKLKDLDNETEITIPKTEIIPEIKKKLSTMGDRRIVFKQGE